MSGSWTWKVLPRSAPSEMALVSFGIVDEQGAILSEDGAGDAAFERDDESGSIAAEHERNLDVLGDLRTAAIEAAPM